MTTPFTVDPEDGVIKFSCDHIHKPLGHHVLLNVGEVITWRRILFGLGGVGYDPTRYGGVGFGNLSARVPPFPGEQGKRCFLITGTQTGRQLDLGPEGMCIVSAYNLNKNRVHSHGPVQPSSESMTHGALYDVDARIRFVFHAHLPILWGNAATLNIPTTAPHIAYGTVAMAKEISRLYRTSLLSEKQILSMGGHEDGVIGFGHSAEEAGLALVRYLARAHTLSLQ